jgi:CDP-glucose 4,6-dehydratase
MADAGMNHVEQGNAPAGPWMDRHVLVTGYSGFVGSWLTTALLELGARVTGFALSADRDSKARGRALVDRGAVAVTGDIRNFDAVHDVMAGQSFDAVFHLAAQPLVRVGLDQPHETLTTNAGGSINVLEAARLCRPSVLVHATSDKCYRNQGWAWPYREVDGLGGGDPYSVSKAIAELVFEAYAELSQSTGEAPNTASVRFGNIIGGDDYAAHRLVPDTIAALQDGAPIRLRRPAAVRPWQHVLDVVRGLILLAEALADGRVAGGETFNFAPPGDGAPVDVLVRNLVDAWIRAGGAEVPVTVTEDPALTEDEILRLDGRKAATALGWTHQFAVPAAAESVVAWHRLVAAGIAPADATAAQVRDFLGGQWPGFGERTEARR